MITIKSILTLEELKEVEKQPARMTTEIDRIINKEFTSVTVLEFIKLSNTSIFDISFTDLLFQELFERFLKA